MYSIFSSQYTVKDNLLEDFDKDVHIYKSVI